MSIIQNIPTWTLTLLPNISRTWSTLLALRLTHLSGARQTGGLQSVADTSCLEDILIDVMLQSLTHSCLCEEMGLSEGPWFRSGSKKCENAACLPWQVLPMSFSFRMSSGFPSPLNEEQTTIVCQTCCFYSSSQWIISVCWPCGWWICIWQPQPGTRLGWAFSLLACQGDIYVS